MAKMSKFFVAAAAGALVMTGHAMAAVIVAQATTGPTYATTLNFDEPGTPTGFVAANFWHASKGLDFQVYEYPGQVPLISNVTTTPGYSWLGTGNTAYGDYGIELDFASPISSLTVSVYDPSGPPTFFGGGFVVDVLKGATDLNRNVYTSAWGGVGKPVFNFTTTAGTTFDSVQLFGLGNDPTTYIDNLSWTVAVVPEPASLLPVGLLAVALRRRR